MIIEGTLISTKEDIPVENIRINQKIYAGRGCENTAMVEVIDISGRYVENIYLNKITTKSKKTLITTPDHIYFASFQTKILQKCVNDFEITLCNFKNLGIHQFKITGEDITDSEVIPRHIKISGTKRSVSGKRIRKWSCTSYCNDLNEIYELAELFKPKFNIIEKATLSRKTLPFIKAKDILPEMSIFVYNKETNRIIDDFVENVEIVNYTGNLYDLNVNKFHSLIANGIVIH